MHWIRFFIGTPKRFLATLAGLVFIFGLFFPHELGLAVSGLLNALMCAIAPFVRPLLTLGVVFLGLGIMLRGVWSKKK